MNPPYDWNDEQDFQSPRKQQDEISELVRRGVIHRGSRADGRYELTAIGRRIAIVRTDTP